MTREHKIVTSFEPPPIPLRQFDWRAWWEDDDWSEGRHVGWGKTEQEAIEDLHRLDEERADYLEDQAERQRNFPFSGSF